MSEGPARHACGLALSALVATGCYQQSSLDDPDAYARDLDGGPADARDTIPDAAPAPLTRDVDLLLAIDSSSSMSEEQAILVEELPGILRVLASGDRDGDGMQDFEPVRSLHVGVITSDLGAGPSDGIPTCGRGLGDDGILRAPVLAPPQCVVSVPSGVFEFAPPDDIDMFATTVGCAAVGTGGCGFEQQLEAVLKAVTPSVATTWTRPGYVPPRFLDGAGALDATTGHADGANAGFLRPDSLLAVVLVSDEEDCSIADYGLFAAADPRFASVPLNLRCNTFGDPSMGLVRPVQRYVEGFLGLRRDPGLLVFTAIAGIPPDVEPAVGAEPDFAAILAHPYMIPRPNAMGTNLEPSCSTVSGVAYPPVRIVQTAEGLAAAGATVSLSSICSSDFGGAFDGLLRRLAR